MFWRRSRRPTGTPQNWRHLLRAPTVTRFNCDFGQTLDRALRSVVHHIIHQQPGMGPTYYCVAPAGRQRDNVGGRS
jgi:hypothetical protein